MKVSVIVPVYNTKKYLEKCLNSLVNQSLKDMEIIVINDGSKEDIESIIEKYKDKIKYIKNPNHGIGYTRNVGIREACGEYVGFVDSDDYVEKNMFLDYYNFAKENILDIVVGNYFKHYQNEIIEMKIKHFEMGDIYNVKDIIVNADYGPCTKIFKREMLIDNKIFFEENLKFEDMPFVAKALKEAQRIGHLDKAYYNYMVRGSSETTTLDERSFDIFKIFDIVINYYKNDMSVFKELEYLVVSKLLDYNIQQRKQKNSKLRNKFIDTTFSYIEENFPNFVSNKYWIKEKLVKRLIKQYKLLTKVYCFVYSTVKL